MIWKLQVDVFFENQRQKIIDSSENLYTFSGALSFPGTKEQLLNNTAGQVGLAPTGVVVGDFSLSFSTLIKMEYLTTEPISKNLKFEGGKECLHLVEKLNPCSTEDDPSEIHNLQDHTIDTNCGASCAPRVKNTSSSISIVLCWFGVFGTFAKAIRKLLFSAEIPRFTPQVEKFLG